MCSFNTRFLNFMFGIVYPLGAALGFDEFSEHSINSSCSFASGGTVTYVTHGATRSALEGSGPCIRLIVEPMAVPESPRRESSPRWKRISQLQGRLNPAQVLRRESSDLLSAWLEPEHFQR